MTDKLPKDLSFKTRGSVLGRCRELNISETEVERMQKEQMIKRTDGWDPDNDIDLAGILLTISTIAKRLAKLLLVDSEKGGKKR